MNPKAKHMAAMLLHILQKRISEKKTSILLKNLFDPNFFLIGIVQLESNWIHSALRPPMAYCASPGWLLWWRNWWNDWQEKPKYSEKTFPSAALSTTNPTCCLDVNPGCCGGKPASNCLSYSTAAILSQDSQQDGWDLNHVLLKYKCRPVSLHHSVQSVQNTMEANMPINEPSELMDINTFLSFW
jgi:hypothetical protein